MEKIWVGLCFETSELSMLTANGSSRVISEALQLTLALYIFKLVLYYNSIIISNQMMYYLAINTGSFCKYSLVFTDML